MGRIDRQRREHGPDVLAIIVVEPDPVVVVESHRLEKTDTVLCQGGLNRIAPTGVLFVDQALDALQDGLKGFRGGESVVAAFRAVTFDLLFETSHPHFKELVKVRARDAEELDPFEQRSFGIERLVEDALIEFEPAQLAVEKSGVGAWWHKNNEGYGPLHETIK